MSAVSVDRVFLDANVLFSAAYRPDAGLRWLWQRGRTALLTSKYALEEAMVSLPEPAHRRRLTGLMESVTLVRESADEPLPADVELPLKDRPMLTAALRADASHLVTGDLTHFGPYLGRSVQGMRILTPAALLGRRRR